MHDVENAGELSWILDVVAVLAEGWKILFALPLLVAAIAIGAVAVGVTPMYRSVAVLPLSSKLRVAYGTEAFIDPILRGSPILAEHEGDLESSRRRLRQLVEPPVEVLRDSGLFKISALAPSPEAAKQLLETVVERLIEFSKPTGSSLETTLENITALETSISELDRYGDLLSQNVQKIPDGYEGEQYARALAGLTSDLSQKRLRLIDLKRSLAGLKREDVLELPTRGERLGAGRFSVVLIATAIAFAAAAAYLLFADHLRKLRTNAIMMGKVDRVRRAFRLSGSNDNVQSPPDSKPGAVSSA